MSLIPIHTAKSASEDVQGTSAGAGEKCSFHRDTWVTNDLNDHKNMHAHDTRLHTVRWAGTA